VPKWTSPDAGDVTPSERIDQQPTTADPGTRRDPWSVTAVVIAAVVIAGCVAAALAAIVPARVDIPGLPTAGRLTELALPAVKAVVDLAAAMTVGWLLAAAWLAPAQRNGFLDVGGYRAIKAASLSATVWAIGSFALIPLILSDTLGRPVDQSLSADWVISGISVLNSVRAALIAGIAALLIAILARAVLHPGWAAVLLVLALVALVPQADSGHSASSGDHDVAVDSMIYHLVGISLWVGGLVAFLGLARQRVEHLDVVARRYSGVALVAFITVAASGLGNAWLRISYLSDLWTTAYGRLVLLKAGLLITLGVIGFVHRRRTLPAIARGERRPLIRLAVVEVLIMAATVGVASALARTATPPPTGAAPSNLELALGFPLNGPPTVGALLFDWRFDWLLGTASIVAAVLYLIGVRRLHRQHVPWPPGRTTAWLAGCALLLVATSSGLARYAAAQFSMHMNEHMVLGMIAPILLVLGGPVTLALRALPAAGRDGVPGLREGIVSAMHSRFMRFITHPLVVFVLFVSSFYTLYFTSLFETMITSHVGHVWMSIHFLTVGYLYYWVIIGIDPAPRQLPPFVKLAILLGALPFHAFFGLALMNSHTAMAADYYTGLGLPWVTDLVAEQRLGGAIAWGATEIPMIIVLIALLSQWARSDEREARRSDRAGDRGADEELDAYNRMLARLAERDGRPPGAGRDDP
jgi:cytochrome c oxidase assembly factor CtaG/putative copper export protein